MTTDIYIAITAGLEKPRLFWKKSRFLIGFQVLSFSVQRTPDTKL